MNSLKSRLKKLGFGEEGKMGKKKQSSSKDKKEKANKERMNLSL